MWAFSGVGNRWRICKYVAISYRRKSTGSLKDTSYRVGSWLTEEARSRKGTKYSVDDFEEFVPQFWREQLSRVDRSDALRLTQQLGGDNRLGWLQSRGSAAKITGLLEKVFSWKYESPDTVLLVQVGDFFEAWGVDAVMLVQWCGLMPMARKPRAGFPIIAMSLQQTLDGLTRAGLSAAVYKQIGQPGQTNQPRVLRQVVTPGAPTYLYTQELRRSSDETSAEFVEGRPYIALRIRSDGFFFAELRPFSREVRFRENVTADAVEAFLSEHGGVATPAILDGPPRAFQQVNRWPWFPKHRKWLRLPDDVSNSFFLEAACQNLSSELNLPAHPAFRYVRLDNSDSLQPLSLATAEQLGVLPRAGTPSLIANMLPDGAPAPIRRFLRQWLLAPRNAATIGAMRELLKALTTDKTLVVPQIQKTPIVAKVVSNLAAKTATEQLFRDIRRCCDGARCLLADPRSSALTSPLLVLVAAETGNSSLNIVQFINDLDSIVEVVDSYLASEDSHYDWGHALAKEVFEDAATQSALARFLERNEGFHGVASVEQSSVASAYRKVHQARDALIDTLRADLPRLTPDALVYNHIDNDLTIKASARNPKSSVNAVDRRGKMKKDRITTGALQIALQAYRKAAGEADEAVQGLLEELASELSSHMTVIVSATTLGHILNAAHSHAVQAADRGWVLPNLSDDEFRVRASPYWLRDDAVSSDVCLGSRGAIATGPNMSGKSTLMRTIGAVALMANCGLMCPAQGSLPQYRQIFFLTADGDRPAEGISSFGHEAQLSAALLHRACDRTLALVDEFGRGTEPHAAQACVGALVEELSRRGTHFVVATHLHGVVELPMRLPHDREPPMRWRMGVANEGDESSHEPRWTYRLERGICCESYAWLALRQFGWSEEAITRFHRLLRSSAIASNPESSISLELSSSHTEYSSNTHPVVSALEHVCSVPEGVIARFSLDDMPPAALCQGIALLYVLCMSDGKFYVGQTDHLQGRLAKHRLRFKGCIQDIFALPVDDTAEARRLEAALQRHMQRIGLPLVSNKDSANKHFGASPRSPKISTSSFSVGNVVSDRDDVAELRRSAEYLLSLADRLEKSTART